MYTKAALLDLHTLTHQGTIKLLDHCSGFSADELHRELDGFGYATLQRQLHHIFEAEQYWVDVLADRYKDSELYSAVEDDAWKKYPTIAEILKYSRRVSAATVDYLQTAADDLLNTPAEYLTWPKNRRSLMPAQVILRVTTHAFHHRGQSVAMCRLLGKPAPSLDFPLTPA